MVRLPVPTGTVAEMSTDPHDADGISHDDSEGLQVVTARVRAADVERLDIAADVLGRVDEGMAVEGMAELPLGDPVITVERNLVHKSYLDLPVVERTGGREAS